MAEEMDTNQYFKSYGDLEVHKLMLNDGVRNRAYKKAIFDNRDAIRDKIVLDVGAGTGILSIFCAQAGAAKVYAVEASDVYKIAEDIVRENGFENVIQVIHSKLEDVVLPEKVDIIVSEWMGFYLLHEAMLDSVIIARDKFLKPSGLIFPESATLYAAPCSVPSMFEQWDNVEGISMKTFSEKLRLEASKKPLTIQIKPEHILSDPEVVLWIDLREINLNDLETIKVQQICVCNKFGQYQGVCLWFICNFTSTFTEPVILTTEPDEPETHWKQTILVLPKQQNVEISSPIAYEICLNRNAENRRHYNIEMTMLDPGDIEHPEYCTCHMTKCILVRAMLEKYEKDSLPQSTTTT